MQPMDENNKALGPVEPFDIKKAEKLLADKKVDHIKVFRLKKGDILTIKGTEYKVTKVMAGGRAMIKRKS